jgi:hypothetical protein
VAKRTVELPGDGEEFMLAQPQFNWVQEKRMGKQVVRYSAKDVWAMGHLIDRGAALPDLAGPDAQDDD